MLYEVEVEGTSLGARIDSALLLSKMIDFFVPSHCKYEKAEVERAIHRCSRSEEALRVIGGENIVYMCDRLGVDTAAPTILVQIMGYHSFMGSSDKVDYPVQSFWGEETQFKELAVLARGFLALSLTNAPLESAFSTWRSIDTHLRQNASDELQYAYLFLQINKDFL